MMSDIHVLDNSTEEKNLAERDQIVPFTKILKILIKTAHFPPIKTNHPVFCKVENLSYLTNQKNPFPHLLHLI